MPDILTDRTIAMASRIAKELHRCFSDVLQLPLIKGHRPADLSRKLGVGRMTCQRILRLCDGETPSPNLLVEIPGINGLHSFLSALKKAGVKSRELTNAKAAVHSFAEFLHNSGLSQTRLAEALSLHYQTTDPERQRMNRRNLFDAAATITGQSADVTISMMAVRPSHDEKFNFEQIAIRGYAGMRASGSAMPIRLPINMAYSDFRNVTGDEAARNPQELVEDFCTRPLPTIDTRVIKAENLAHIINPEHIPTGEPFDCFAIQNSHWNVSNKSRNTAIWLYVDYPTRHCIFDLYVHQSIASVCELSGECHLWGTSLLAPLEDQRTPRFADQMVFTPLGTGLENASSSTFSRHKELTRYMFDSHQWNTSEFVGFRCEMELPIWRSGLCVILDGS